MESSVQNIGIFLAQEMQRYSAEPEDEERDLDTSY